MNNWMDGETLDGNKRMEKREEWGRQEWAMTIALMFLFPPIGIAAIWRWLSHRRVWH